MADEKQVEDSCICSICLEAFKTPRYLQECHHNFCEQCIFSFVERSLSEKILKLRSTNGNFTGKIPKEENYFECPLCRIRCRLPRKGVVTIEWIRSAFPLNNSLVHCSDRVNIISPSKFQSTVVSTEQPGSQTTQDCKKMSIDASEIVASDLLYCNPCLSNGENLPAVKFCMHCCEALCKDCVDSHSKFKVLKTHQLVSCEERSNQSFLKDVTLAGSLADFMKCNRHEDRTVEFFCRNDNNLCCKKCVTVDHRGCQDVVELTEVESEATQFAEEVIRKYLKAADHFEYLQKLKQENLSKVNVQLDSELEKVKSVSAEIIKKVNSMMENTCSKIKALKIDTAEKIEIGIGKLQSLKDICLDNVRTLKTVQECSSNTHTLIVAKNLKRDFQRIRDAVEKEDEKQESFCIKLNCSGDLNSLPQKISKCTVTPEVNVVPLSHKSFVREHDFYMDSMVFTRPVINMKNKQADFSPAVRSIAVVKNCVIVCDHINMNLFNYVIGEYFNLTVTKIDSAFCIARFNEDFLVVSGRNKKDISFAYVDTLTGKIDVMKSFHPNKRLFAVHSMKGRRLGVSWLEPNAFGILEVKLQGSNAGVKEEIYLAEDKAGRKFHDVEFFAVDEERCHFVQSCTAEKAVFCFTFDGDPVFEYRDEHLELPYGVDIDKYGNIFVLNHQSGNNGIHVISPTGILCCVLRRGVVIQPLALCFDDSRETLYMTSSNLAYNDKVHWLHIKDVKSLL